MLGNTQTSVLTASTTVSCVPSGVSGQRGWLRLTACHVIVPTAVSILQGGSSPGQGVMVSQAQSCARANSTSATNNLLTYFSLVLNIVGLRAQTGAHGPIVDGRNKLINWLSRF